MKYIPRIDSIALHKSFMKHDRILDNLKRVQQVCKESDKSNVTSDSLLPFAEENNQTCDDVSVSFCMQSVEMALNATAVNAIKFSKFTSKFDSKSF